MSEQKEAWPPEGVRCETCAYWEQYKGVCGDEGTCHRHAPRPIQDSLSNETENDWRNFPVTLVEDWCGEWRARTPDVFSSNAGLGQTYIPRPRRTIELPEGPSYLDDLMPRMKGPSEPSE